MTNQQRKFKVAVRACWRKMAAGTVKVSPKGLGGCMRKALKGKHRKARKSSKRKSKR